jgi:UDP-2,3-diacylglucosamine pyrophosphatase LpxH
MRPGGEQPTLVRLLADDTLLVFLSDCHIGGDKGRDIFESPDDLTALFHELSAHPGPVELVLAGDFFDCLRIGAVESGENRISQTLANPAYADLFAGLRALASGKDRKLFYMPGNHDAEVWWNADIRRSLKDAGLVHEFTLSYAASFASDPEALVYCEHGNEFDPANLKRNYDDPYDTPLGDHIVTDIIPRLPHGWTAAALQLSEIDHVFPLDILPQWVAGRLFYALVSGAIRWLLIPLTIAYIAFELFAYAIGMEHREINAVVFEIISEVGFLIIAFAFFFFLAWRIADRAIRSSPQRPVERRVIHDRLARSEEPPLAARLPSPISVFISGHTHAPALSAFARPAGGEGFVVNSGCWLRQLHALPTRFRLPPVFHNRFVQTHVRITRRDGALDIALWGHPRPSSQSLRTVEWLAVIGRLPPEPTDLKPRVVASASVSSAQRPV